MRDDVRDAIESVALATEDNSRRRRIFSEATVRRLLLAVISELPEDMTIMELREELE